MNKRQAENYSHLINTLTALGFKYHEIQTLLRIERTLTRWHEGECGNEYGCIERDEATDKPYMRNAMTGRRYAIADRENGALKRLGAIIKARNARELHTIVKTDVTAYIQGDCRGCALYIMRPGDVREGEEVNAVYSRGIAICY